MVTILSLWLPVLLSAVFVFIVSSVIHMLFQYHSSDYDKLPKEDEVMESLRQFDIEPGNYVMPYAGSMKAMNDETYIEKRNTGPVAILTVSKAGPSGMGKQLLLWFVYSVVVSIFSAYIAGRALAPGAEYLAVFRFVGATAFIAYSVGIVQDSIFFERKWSATLKYVFDGLVFALVTAATFSWLWPAA